MKKENIIFFSFFLLFVIVATIFSADFFNNATPKITLKDIDKNPQLSNNTNAHCYGGYPWVEEIVYGRDVSLPTIYADKILNEIGYNSDYYLESDSNLILTNITNSSVIYYIGHGCPSALCFDSSSGIGQRDITKMKDGELSDLDLAIYISFGSASDSRNGNIANETYQKGAKCVVGFQSKLLMENSKKWSDYFMERLKSNMTVRNSANTALWDEILYFGGDTGNMEHVKIYGSENIMIRRITIKT